MGNDLKKRLAELDRQIEEMKVTGNRAAQAALHGQKALLYALARDMRSAANEIARAGVLAEEDGQYEQLAQAHLAKGKALLNQPGQRKAAREALQKAEALYHTLEEHSQEAEALKELAALDGANGDFESAAGRLSQAITALEGSDEPELSIELYRLRARAHMLQRDLDAALADLDTALGAAQKLGNDVLALEIRVEQMTVRSLQSEGMTTGQMASLLQEAQQSGNLGAVADVRLQQATESFQAGEYRQALEQVQAARQAARDGQDIERHLRYLMASLLMVDVWEKMGDRAEALAALLTCKVYLEAQLGPQMEHAMTPLLDALEQRWGREGLAEAVRLYKERVQERGPYQA